MIDVILDTVLDCIKLLPFLFIGFLLVELIEHKFSNKSKKLIKKCGKYGPFVASLLGLVPQCGFSVMATNLYITRIITLGTLISIYLSCSDEMVIILLSKGVSVGLIVKILLTKFIIGVLFGFIIDLLLRKQKKIKENYDICEKEHCHCDKGIVKSSITHTLNIFIFIFIVTFILNLLFAYGLEDYLYQIFNKNSYLSIFITSLIGFIPNCGSSVIITELYLNNIINYSAMISGLLSASGVAIMVLFKSNKNILENIKIMGILYTISVISGIILELII